MTTIYHLPQLPLSPADVHNRRAAAVGSVATAMAAESGDFNGHRVVVDYRPHAISGPVWIAAYRWSGQQTLGRGSFEDCLRAAVAYMARGARGSSVLVNVARADFTPDMAFLLGQLGFQQGEAPERPDWWTDEHDAARAIPVRDAAFGGY